MGRLGDNLVDRLLLEVRQEREPTRATGRVTHDRAVVDQTKLGEVRLERLCEQERKRAGEGRQRGAGAKAAERKKDDVKRDQR